VTAEQYRQKAERYLAYARRMKNQDAKTAIIDRAIECIRLAGHAALDKSPYQEVNSAHWF
jgi:hypothetical protein